MATYDQAGNPIPEGDAVFPTDDPNIVRARYRSGDPLPVGAAIRTDADGTKWVYYPTAAALAAGKLMAAWDTILDTPARVTETVQEAMDSATGASKWIIVGLVAYALIEALRMMEKR